MESSIQLYDADTIEKCVWPDTEIGRQAKGLLLSLVKEGVEKFVSNVTTKYFVVVIDDVVLPLTVNECEYQNSYVVSNYYAVNGMEEWFNKVHPKLNLLQKPLSWSLKKFFHWVKINKVVMVNNWLFSTNLYPILKPNQISLLAHFLRDKFPQHVHIFRGVNTLKGSELLNTLKKESFNLIGIRQVYIYDPNQRHLLSPKVHYHHRRDLRLMEKHDYEVIRDKEIKKEDFPRLIDLYKQIYVNKYTSFSPSYTVEFLREAYENGVIQFVGLKKQGSIDGIMGVRVLNGMMTVPFFGYETSIPQSVGLYRILSVLAIKEAENRGVILNDSSGSSAPKMFRGLKPHEEYIAVFDKHLPFNQRIFWTGAGMIVNKLVFPFVKKKEKSALLKDK